jgi:VanZ family protein
MLRRRQERHVGVAPHCAPRPIDRASAGLLSVESSRSELFVPGSLRPHILGNGRAEHFVAYFITGGLFAIGYFRPMQQLASGVMLAICAGSLEFVQLWIPGRTANARDFAASTIGAWVGLLIIASIRRARERKLVVSYINDLLLRLRR